MSSSTSSIRTSGTRGKLGAATLEVVLVEPYLEGTSTAEVSPALQATPHRVLSLGTSRRENRHYGTGAEHFAAHGLDEAGIRASITEFVAQRVAV